LNKTDGDDKGLLQIFHDDIIDWCAGRMWYVRVPLLAFMVWIAFNQFVYPSYFSLFSGINLGIHEGGHLIFRSLGEFLHAAGGTILQLMAPLATIGMFLKQRDYFGVSVAFAWLSTNFYEIARYMADAEKLELDLVTVGDSGGIVQHDWRFLFTRMGLLEQCEGVAWLTRQLGLFSILFAIVFGAWVLYLMAVTPAKPRNISTGI
jgi:hypothetical protein